MHLGLVAMRERAELAGGWCRVHSAPTRGTVVEFWIPWHVGRGEPTPEAPTSAEVGAPA